MHTRWEGSEELSVVLHTDFGRDAGLPVGARGTVANHDYPRLSKQYEMATAGPKGTELDSETTITERIWTPSINPSETNIGQRNVLTTWAVHLTWTRGMPTLAISPFLLCLPLHCSRACASATIGSYRPAY